uniref:Uncharacterized protein n=1 Tax=Oncorhynchus mykiss TaxID=8022 RepID=A0A8C7SNT4_ONCMY
MGRRGPASSVFGNFRESGGSRKTIGCGFSIFSGASPEYSNTELAGVPCKVFVNLIWTNYTTQSELFVVAMNTSCCITRLELNGLRMGLSETKNMAQLGECLSFPTSGLTQMSFQQCHTLVYCYCLNRNKKQCDFNSPVCLSSALL